MKAINKWKIILMITFGLFILTSMAHAQQSFQVMGCSSGTRQVLLESKALTVYSVAGKGEAWSATGDEDFKDMTWDFMATLRVAEGMTIGIGYYKFTDPDQDYFILEANGNAILEGGTWNFLYGTGKWKKISGKLKSRATLLGKPVSVEQEKYWCRIIGTIELPK